MPHPLYQLGLKDIQHAVVSTTDAEMLRSDYQDTTFEIVTSGAETRTLAAPTAKAQRRLVVLDTDGGDCTLTVTNGYNLDGDTTLTLDDAGDWVLFVSVEVAGTLSWRMVAQEGTNAAVENLAVDTLTVNGTSIAPGDMTPGAGISGGTGTICEHWVVKIGGLVRTSIVIDLTGLNSSAAADIIGKQATAGCHLGQITAAVNGTIFAGSMTCLETPAGGEPDIDLYSATEATGTEDAAIGDLTETALLAAAADWTANTMKGLTAAPAANTYLYLVGSGDGTDATYTAGIFLIELWGKA